MRKSIRVSEPNAEMRFKMKRACNAVASQKKRMVKCPVLPTQFNRCF